MKKQLTVALLAAAFGIAGCATTDTQPASSSPSGASAKEEEYVTGSRLPRKASTEGTKSLSKDDWRLETNRGIGNAPRGN